jgi:cytochrome c oxidase subunit 2
VQVKERTIFTLAVVTLIILAVSFFTANNLNLMPTAASGRAEMVDELTRFMIGIATAVFLVVEGGLIYVALRFRKRKGDETDAKAYHGNTTLEVIWTFIPAVIVVVIGVYSFNVLTEIERPSDDELVVEVIGRQFLWEFRYPEQGRTTQELHIPVNVPVRFEITSEDVIHSFWIPEFRAKRDATPGQVSDLLITPTRIGRYPIRCAELCGAGHAAMNAFVIVESQSDFEAWLQGDQASAAEETGPEAVATPPGQGNVDEEGVLEGRNLFIQLGCGGCHTLEDAGAVGSVGPILDGIGLTAEGRLAEMDAEEYIRQSILNPDAYIVEGYDSGLMPANNTDRLSDGEVETLVQYLLAQ